MQKAAARHWLRGRGDGLKELGHGHIRQTTIKHGALILAEQELFLAHGGLLASSHTQITFHLDFIGKIAIGPCRRVKTALDALSVIAGLDEEEQFALERAMLEHFGPCTCQSPQMIGSANPPAPICARHRFLEEQDANVSRLQRLVYVRRTRAYWSQQEMCGLRLDDDSRTGEA